MFSCSFRCFFPFDDWIQNANCCDYFWVGVVVRNVRNLDESYSKSYMRQSRLRAVRCRWGGVRFVGLMLGDWVVHRSFCACAMHGEYHLEERPMCWSAAVPRRRKSIMPQTPRTLRRHLIHRHPHPLCFTQRFARFHLHNADFQPQGVNF